MSSPHGELPLKDDRDVVLARQSVRRMTQELKFTLVDQTKMVTATSELARNAVRYGGGGMLHWEILATPHVGLRLTFSDEGPGIENLELALTDGWTSGEGLGMGLTGARRLVHEFDIQTQVGVGTRVTVTRWK
ncbi:MAG TPA: anti-sigma regulatory factor [Steroidobacteraceae bacterium]|jgi:serine/threonine-protein kinase RsbT|nr:anti-sigma regulatory factor [Steroidobacteraceae bacterium]